MTFVSGVRVSSLRPKMTSNYLSQDELDIIEEVFSIGCGICQASCAIGRSSSYLSQITQPYHPAKRLDPNLVRWLEALKKLSRIIKLSDTEKKKVFADWKAKRGEGMNSVENKPKEYGFSKEEIAERWQERYDILMEKYKALKKELKNEEEASKEVIYALVEKVDRQEKIINVLCDAIPTDENTRLLRGR